MPNLAITTLPPGRPRHRGVEIAARRSERDATRRCGDAPRWGAGRSSASTPGATVPVDGGGIEGPHRTHRRRATLGAKAFAARSRAGTAGRSAATSAFDRRQERVGRRDPASRAARGRRRDHTDCYVASRPCGDARAAAPRTTTGMIGDEAPRVIRRIGDDRREETGHVVGRERQPPRRRLVQGDAERPDVAPVVDVLRAADLFRGHVRRRAEDRLRLGEEFEIDDDPSVPIAFAMPKSSTFTCGRPSALRVRKKFDGFRSRWMTPTECALATASQTCSMTSAASWITLSEAILANGLREIATDEVLHHDVRRVAVLERARVEHLHDVRALDLHDRAGFARETLGVDLVARRLWTEQLDRDLVVAALLVLRGDRRCPHAAGAEQAVRRCTAADADRLRSAPRAIAAIDSCRPRRFDAADFLGLLLLGQDSSASCCFRRFARKDVGPSAVDS